MMSIAFSGRPPDSLVSSILNYKYSGEPLSLQTFITDVGLVVEMIEEVNAEISNLCFKYVKSKLDGRALEAMPDNLSTVQQNLTKQKVPAAVK